MEFTLVATSPYNYNKNCANLPESLLLVYRALPQGPIGNCGAIAEPKSAAPTTFDLETVADLLWASRCVVRPGG